MIFLQVHSTFQTFLSQNNSNLIKIVKQNIIHFLGKQQLAVLINLSGQFQPT
jgi:hypothetical protein